MGAARPAVSAATVMAAFACYLSRMTGRDEVVLNVPMSARTSPETRRAGGMTVEVVPLRLGRARSRRGPTSTVMPPARRRLRAGPCRHRHVEHDLVASGHPPTDEAGESGHRGHTRSPAGRHAHFREAVAESDSGAMASVRAAARASVVASVLRPRASLTCADQDYARSSANEAAVAPVSNNSRRPSLSPGQPQCPRTAAV